MQNNNLDDFMPEVCEKTLRDLEVKFRERKLADGLDIIRNVSDRSDYSKLLATYMKVHPKTMHLDDFMPTKLQQELLDRGLDTFKKVMDKKDFIKLKRTLNAVHGGC